MKIKPGAVRNSGQWGDGGTSKDKTFKYLINLYFYSGGESNR